jgi:two-component system, sensor histidine kinase PdtaS
LGGYAAKEAELTAALAREEDLRRERSVLSQHQNILTQEFEHRLANSLQMIVSLLSLQSRVATTIDAAAQLNIAAQRVAAVGRVHRRLHLLDHQRNVEFKQYLQDLCGDLSELLLPQGMQRAVAVAGINVRLLAALGIPLGFIVSELITNSSKYGKGNITVRMEGSACSFALGGGRRARTAGQVQSHERQGSWHENRSILGETDWRHTAIRPRR